MPVPIVDPTASVQSLRQGEYSNFQPYAYNAPTAWAAGVGLPPGMRMDPLKGIIYGSSDQPGIYVFGVRAYNSSGWSAEQRFTIRIQNSGIVSLTPCVDLEIDVVNRVVYFPTLAPNLDRAVAAISGKFGDTLLLRLRFTKAGVGLDLPLSSLKVAIKKYEEEKANLVLTESSDAAWRKRLSGTSTYFDVLLPLTGNALKNALGDSEGEDDDDTTTAFEGLAEIEWKWPIAWGTGDETTTLTNTSATFKFTPVRDFIPNA